VDETSARRAATRESARTPFVRSPTVTRGPRGQTGASGSRRRCVRVARLVSRRSARTLSAGASILAPFSSSTFGTRDPASTSAHRPPLLHPQASKRHDVSDLRRRATREQRGRPEHPRVEPPGASFARHLTHVHARVRSKRGGCICRFSMTAYPYGSRFFRRKPREKAGFFDGAVPRRSRDSFSPEPLFAIPPFASAGQVPQA
jgi:hypothetical protein